MLLAKILIISKYVCGNVRKTLYKICKILVRGHLVVLSLK